MKNIAKTAIWVGLIMFIFYLPSPANAGDTAFSSACPEIHSAMRSSVRSLGLQTQLPAAENHPLDGFFSRRNIMPNAAAILFYGSLAAIAAVIFMTWRDNLWSSSRARKLQTFRRSNENSSPDAPAAWEEQSRLEADDLAGRGNFAEAMRILLLRSVEELRRYLKVSIAASLTSREILHHVALPPEGRSVLADIINRVEISYFGEHKPGADEYKACRISFDALTDVLRGYSMTGGANTFMTQ